MIGDTIGHYRVLATLGSGGMGVVYKAEDLKLGRTVALKFLADGFADEPSLHDRFLHEARAAAALNHPNICTIYEINDGGGRPFIAMELLEGETLQQRLEAGPLPLPGLLDLAIQVADGLDAAHTKGLVHRDIKPGNIFITADGRAKVVDFGLAKTTDDIVRDIHQSLIQTGADEQVVTRPGTALGTVAYMSPEQARGQEIDARSDIFSFGLVLYEMATGRRAFDGATTAVVFDGILNRMPLPPSFVNPTVPAELEQVIGCAIEKDPAARYQRAAQLASDLRRLRRASDPEVAAVDAAFTPSAATGSPAWGVTPARALEVASRPPAASGARVSTRRMRAWPLLLFAAGLLAGLAGGVAWWLLHGHSMRAGAPVLVADFINRTGDPDFDGTLKQALTIKLEESPYVSVLPQQKVRETLSLMARRPDDAVTPVVALEMCQRVPVGAVMTGEIVRLGTPYVLTLTAESCSGDEIGREQVEAARKDDVLNALGTALASMRRRLGESLASVRSHDKPMIEATTSSLPALKSFAEGDRKRAAGVDLEAIPYYRAAVAADPKFALAWARLGTVYGNTGEDELSRQCYQKAYDLRDRASEHERFYIESHYYRTVAGDLTKARDEYDLWRQQYPHDFVPVHNLGVVYLELGEPERALKAFQEASTMEPQNRLARETTADTLVALGRYDEARETAEREIKDLGDSPQPHLTLYGLDYLAGNQAGMAEHARALRGSPLDLQRQALDYQIAALEGRFTDARAIRDRTVQVAEGDGRTEYAQSIRAADVLNRALVDMTAQARADATRMLASKPSDANSLTLAFALLLSGDVARARAVAAPLWARLERDVSTARIMKPAFDALGALREGHAAQSVELLKDTEPWEDRLKPGQASAHVRAMVYLALGDGRKAEEAVCRRSRSTKATIPST